MRLSFISLCALLIGLSACRFEYFGDHVYFSYNSDCADADEVRQGFVLRINTVRSSGGYCDTRYYPPAPPVAWNGQLAEVAAGHAQDMAQYNFISHQGSNGTGLNIRLQTVGYSAPYAAETLGGGYDNPETALNYWLTDPVACAHLRAAWVLEIGGACAGRENSQYGTYWNLILAAS